jgi:hypothetical protein
VEHELGRPEYHRSLLERFSSWLGDLWDGLTRAALDASPLSAGAAAVVLVALLALGLALAGRVRREPHAPRRPDDAVVGQGDSAEEHRAAAQRALDAGDAGTALVEAFRALASRSARRGLLDVRPGLTAREVAAELGRVFVTRTADLTAAADLFDRVFYGDQPADPDDARAVLRLDEALSKDRPVQAVDVAGDQR